MTNQQAPRIGIIAEDDSDVNSAKIMIRRIAKNDRVGFKRSVGKGCGKIKRKCHSWAINLKDRGCSLLILLHDLDRKDLVTLKNEILSAIKPCPINNFLICIPVEEMEAWFLADPLAIKRALNLQKMPNIKGHPEQIKSPKEHLGLLVRRISNGEKIYINTKHNEKISEVLDFKRVKKCPSFMPFFNFIRDNVNCAR